MIIVSDTSPLSYLSHLGELRLLRELFGEVIIPPAVLSEWERDSISTNDRVQSQQAGWFKVETPRNGSAVSDLRKSVDEGEAEAIVLAQEKQADLLLIDERGGGGSLWGLG